MPMKLIDETGNVYGALTVIKPVREPGMRKTMWLCRCECGNEKIINGSELRAGKRTSCGKHCNSIVDETGKEYGFLKVIKKDPTPALDFPDRSVHWICECLLCNSICSISGRNLRNGNARSCGCMKSKGEQYILKYLNENKYDYKKEYCFHNLKGENGLLRFDFAIFNNDKIKYLIEFQGAQHFEPNHFLGGEEEFNQRVEYDKKKEQYCLDNNLLLLKICVPKGMRSEQVDYSEIEKIIKNYEEKIKGDNYEQIFSKHLRSISS